MWPNDHKAIFSKLWFSENCWCKKSTNLGQQVLFTVLLWLLWILFVNYKKVDRIVDLIIHQSKRICNKY